VGANVLAVGSSRACQLIPRVAANASDLTYRIGQNDRRTKFFIAPARIERLLEDQIYIQVLYTDSYYSANAG
jgi:hypothetical protein